MKRIIIDYKKLNTEISTLLAERYPDGYSDSDILKFKNLKGEEVEAIEVRAEDTIYLVKVGIKLQQAMDDFDIEESEEPDFDLEDEFSDQ